ncbi:MAG: L,D-transpeptidase family protein [Eubacteriales bacterium]|nr:L,D-transpeptidase family protein [Eubacteriales bacterium]
MKKRIVAVVLSLTLCMATVLQASAAEFVDQPEAVSAAVFEDSFDDLAAGGDNEAIPAEPVDIQGNEQEVSPVPVTPEEVTPTPEVPEEITPIPEDPEEITPTPEVPAETFISPETPEEETPDVDIFNAGENVEVPEEVGPADTEVELMADTSGKIYASNWKYVNGKWKLLKPVSTTLKASAGDAAEAVGGNLAASAGGDVFGDETVSEEEGNDAGEVFDAEEADAGNTAPAEEAISTEETPVEENGLTADETFTAAAGNYYTAADGIVHIKTYRSVTSPTLMTEGDYYFDEAGYMVTGRKEIKPGTPGFSYKVTKEFYFMSADKIQEGNANAVCKPTTSDLGKMQKRYWLWDGKTFRFYSKTGIYQSETELKKISTANKTYTGYHVINGEKYFLTDKGVPRVGHITITEGKKPGKYYGQPAKTAGDIPGKAFKSGWLRIKDSKGVIQWRKYQSDGRYLERGIVATKLDKTIDPSVKDDVYLLSATGYIIKSKMVKAANGYYYCTDKYGRVYKSKVVKYKNVRYYFSSTGRRVTWTNSWHRIPANGNRYYYFGKTPGRIVEKKGWQRIIKTDGKSAGWFYFPSSGNHYVNRLTASGRYFRPDGRLASGITTVNGKTYFFRGSTTTKAKGTMYKNTWIRYNNNWYYAGSNGTLYKNGWKYIKGGYYYFNTDYTVKTNASVTRNGVSGYVDARGKFVAANAGWVIVNDAKNQVKYMDSSGIFAVNCSKVIDGLRYYFDKNGYRINDLTGLYSGPYYLVVDRVNGVMTVYDSSRTVPLKTIRVSVGLPGTPTWPTNKDMKLTSYNRWQELMGPSWGQYGTHVDEAGNGGIFIHSVAGGTRSYYNVSPSAYNLLGQPASHGCIRCCVADARWVFYNCNGSTIRIIDGTYNANESMKGPLGRKALVPMYGSCNFDPTDNLAWH